MLITVATIAVGVLLFVACMLNRGAADAGDAAHGHGHGHGSHH